MKKWIALMLASAAGAMAIHALFPRWDSSANGWRARQGRGEAIQATRNLAADLGQSLDGWKMSVRADWTRGLEEAQSAHPDSALAAFLPPLKMTVLASSPRDQRTFRAGFFSDGRLAGYEWKNAPPAVANGFTEGVAVVREFERLAGSHVLNFHETTRGAESREGSRHSWEWNDPDTPGELARIAIVVKNSRVVRAEVAAELSASLMEDARRRAGVGSGMLGLLTAGFIFGLIVLGVWAFFSRLGRRRDHLRFAVRIGAIMAVLLAATFPWSALMDQLAFTEIERGGAWFSTVVGTLFLLALIGILLGAGYSLLSAVCAPRWVGWICVARGRLWTRPVGAALAAGLLAGPALGSLPYLVAAAGWTSESKLSLNSPEVLSWKAPAIAIGHGGPLSLDAVAIFGVLIPLLYYQVRPRWARWALYFATASIVFGGLHNPFAADMRATLLTGMLLAGALGLLHRWFGSLAAMVAVPAMEVGPLVMTYLAQPSAELARSGWGLLWMLAGTTVLAGIAARFGARVDEEAAANQVVQEASEESESARERLLAEFSVAQRAQRKMLPQRPPQLDGFTLAAVCQPAREVGGDLYDFLKLPGRQLGLCVADVSGKGVSASLYMTLTKGMLASAARHESDGLRIAALLNRHLCALTPRKTFVTFTLAVLDPATRTIEHVRAGHNPILLRRGATGETIYIRPDGIGLGLVSNATFQRTLEKIAIQLQSGDLLLLYSDGLTEAMNPHSELFGEERLLEVIEEARDLDADGVLRRVLDEVERHTAGAEPHDDLTLVVLRANDR